jgi:hypothetical protein
VSVVNFLKPEINFKRVSGGWIFRGPNPWLLGEAPHYLVNDDQKLRIIVAIRSTAMVFPILLLITVVAAVATLRDSDEIALVFFVMVAMLVCIFGIAAVQRQILKPVLVGASPTNERITNAEVRKADEESTPREQVRRRWIAPGVVCSLAALQVILNWDRPGRAIFFALAGFVFGWQAIRWYRVSKRSRSLAP